MILKFGTVIKVRGKDYVYLGSTERIVYLAQILDSEVTNLLLNRWQKIMESSAKKGDPIYKVIKLKTEEFKDKGAHCYKTDNDADILENYQFDVLGNLNNADKEAIKEELLIEDGFVPKGLQELIREFE